MDSYRPFGIGVGSFAIIAVWTVVLAMLLLLSRLPRVKFVVACFSRGQVLGCRKVGSMLLLSALFFTLALLYLPRQSKVPEPEDVTVYDDTLVRRLALLVLMAVTTVTGLRLLVVLELRKASLAQRLSHRYIDYYHGR